MYVNMCVTYISLIHVVGRGRLRINKIENVGKALTFLTQEKKVSVYVCMFAIVIIMIINTYIYHVNF